MSRMFSFDTKGLLSEASRKLKNLPKSLARTFYRPETLLTREDINIKGHGQRKADEIPKELIGNISDLSPLNQQMYKRLMRNCSDTGPDGRLVQVGMLNGSHIKSLLENTTDEYTNNLNLFNQRAARHILSLANYDENLDVLPLKYLAVYMQLNLVNFSEEFAKGRLSYDILGAMGKIYKDVISFGSILTSKGHSIPQAYFPTILKSTEKILKDNPECEGQDWTTKQRYHEFLRRVADNNPYSDLKAAQLLIRGFMHKNISEAQAYSISKKDLEKYI